jgi:hypothetical protein
MDSRPDLHPLRNSAPTESLATSTGVGPAALLPSAELKRLRPRRCKARELIERADALARLSPGRIAELYRRLLTGAYSSRAVLTEVAARLLDRGDL